MGDGVYGPHFKTKASHLGPSSQAALAALGRQALHAYLLALEHPRTGEILQLGSRLCRRIWFSCRTPCERRYDAGRSENTRYTNRLWQPHGDVTLKFLPNRCPIWCMLHLR